MKQYYRTKSGKSLDISVDTPFKSSLYTARTKKKGGDSLKNKTFKEGSDYYITLTELFSSIREYPVAHNPKKPFEIEAEFVRVKPGKQPVAEIHKDVKVRYLACVVYNGIEFSKLDKRKIECDDWDDDHVVYYIPISIIHPLISSVNSRDEINSARELMDLKIFQYTGSIESFQTESIFTLANKVYLTNKTKIEDCRIKVII